MCIHGKAFIFKPISNQLNILVGYKLSFTKSLNAPCFQMDGWFYADWTTSKILPPLFHL